MLEKQNLCNLNVFLLLTLVYKHHQLLLLIIYISIHSNPMLCLHFCFKIILIQLVKRCTHGILLFHLIRSRKKISISRNKEVRTKLFCQLYNISILVFFNVYFNLFSFYPPQQLFSISLPYCSCPVLFFTCKCLIQAWVSLGCILIIKIERFLVLASFNLTTFMVKIIFLFLFLFQ